jgi:glutathione S-transferase
VKLYVCWNTNPGPAGVHPCGRAHQALREAGHEPEVIKSRGLRLLPDRLNQSEGRREAKRLTGSTTVPVLVTDAGDVISESKRIVAWARAHPAAGPA